jgi:hypothetical protein
MSNELAAVLSAVSLAVASGYAAFKKAVYLALAAAGAALFVLATAVKDL